MKDLEAAILRKIREWTEKLEIQKGSGSIQKQNKTKTGRNESRDQRNQKEVSKGRWFSVNVKRSHR